jgi:hypothetical protein
LAYQLQAEELGDLAPDTIRLLMQIASCGTIHTAARLTSEFHRRRSNLKLGTVLMRAWKGRSHRVMVVDEGFAWNGKTSDSLSKIACAITGTKCGTAPAFLVFAIRSLPRPTHDCGGQQKGALCLSKPGSVIRGQTFDLCRT